MMMTQVPCADCHYDERTGMVRMSYGRGITREHVASELRLL